MCEQGRDKEQRVHVCAWEIFTSLLPSLSEKSDTLGLFPLPAGSVPSQEPAWQPGTTLISASWDPGAPVQAAPPSPAQQWCPGRLCVTAKATSPVSKGQFGA